MKKAFDISLVSRFLLIASFSVAGVFSASAESRLGDLKNGMASREVVKAWGEPLDREEHEVKRIEIWRYPKGGRVTFHENKVTEWKLPTQGIMSKPVAEKTGILSTGSADAGSSLNPDTRDLVREIAKEVPSGPDVPFSDPGDGLPNAVPVIPNPSQQIQPGVFANPPFGSQADDIE